MPSTESPITLGPRNAGTHNSWIVQRSWRHSWYFEMIGAWRLGDFNVQFDLDRFVISKRIRIEVSMQWIQTEFETGDDEFRAKRGAPPGKQEFLMSCAKWARGVPLAMEECRMKLSGASPGQGGPTRIEKCLCCRAPHLGWGAPKCNESKESGIVWTDLSTVITWVALQVWAPELLHFCSCVRVN
jgi:hypothetical protein